MKIFFTIISILYTVFLFSERTSCTDVTKYREFCLLAATQDKVFQTFKSNPIYREVLEHVNYEQGKEYLQLIENNYPDLLSQWDLFKSNDSVGGPITSYYSQTGFVSPSTLRYVKILGDLCQFLGEDGLTKKRILEIGGGYGGQCKIISDWFNFLDYTIVDLPEPLALTKRYLCHFSIKNVNYLQPYDIQFQDSFDLVISNYAFSECSLHMQQEYFEKYILNSKAGYMIYNDSSGAFPLSYTALQLQELLNNSGFRAYISPEEPLTGSKNVLLTWRKC